MNKPNRLKNLRIDQIFDKSNEYLAAIITHSSEAIYSKTLTGIVTSWNPAAERMYGYLADEIIGRHIDTIVPKTGKDELKWIFSQLKKGIFIENYETIRQRKDGTRLTVSVSISPIKNEEEKIIGASVIARDITEQKQQLIDEQFMAEVTKVLSFSLDYNETLSKIATLSVPNLADWCGIDLLTEEGIVEQVAVSHIDPKKIIWAKELRKKNPVDLTDTTGIAKVMRTGEAEFYPYLSDDIIRQTTSDPEKFALIKKLELRSVMIVPLTIRKKTIGTITFVSTREDNLYNKKRLLLAEDLARRASQAIDNATLFKQLADELEERKRMENALRESEMKYRKLFESSIIGVVISNLDGQLLEMNQTFLDMLGYSREDFDTGRVKAKDLTPEKWLMGNAKAIEEVRTFGELAPWEKEYIRKDGSTIPVLLGSTMLDPKKEIVLTFILDNSKQKEIERRKDDFISIASHELKTPVTSMKVFTQLLAKRFEKQSDVSTASLISKIDGQLNKLIVLISDLLDVSRINAGKLALRIDSFDINSLIEETIEGLVETTEHTIVFNKVAPCEIQADADRIAQVLTNLLTNAIKYSQNDKKIIVKVTKRSSEVEIEVEDFGIGIGVEEQERIFERFYQSENLSTHNTYPGLGMGLYISAEIVRRHGGRIWVQSKKGEGSHFFFTLPIRNSQG